MTLETLGKLSFLVRPIFGQEFNLVVYVNHSADSRTIEFDCQYTPLSNESDNYFIRSTYRASEVTRAQGKSGSWDIENTLLLRGSIRNRCSINVMHRVSSDIERVMEVLNKVKTMLRNDPKGFKSSLSWHIRSMEHDGTSMRQALRDRGFIVGIEILALCLLSERHIDPKIGSLAGQFIDQVFIEKSASLDENSLT